MILNLSKLNFLHFLVEEALMLIPFSSSLEYLINFLSHYTKNAVKNIDEGASHNEK